MPGMKSGCFIAKALFIAVLAVGLIGCEQRSSKISKCVLNLRQIQICKELWADNERKTTNDVPSWNDLSPYFPDPKWSNSIPVCPAGGAHKLGRVGEQPTCSIGGPEHSSQYYTK
jgi:hypothetical protein